jgi:hypothetical protein
MKESFQVKQNFIEKSANYEGNETLLFQERIQNPEIKKQLVNTMYFFFSTRETHDKEDELPMYVKSKKEIERELDEEIEKVFSSTNLDFSDKGSSHGNSDVGTVKLYSINPETREKWTQKQLSIAEAHEKGHAIRSFFYPGKEFIQKIHGGFDFSFMLSDDLINSINKERHKDLSEKDAIEYISQYHKDPMEIIERMAQLKNYFGMKGNEKFTKEHLDYAKKNYVKDTGSPLLQIQPFLNSITPKTEQKFIELINSLGI